MTRALLIALGLMAQTTQASELRLVELRELSMEYYEIANNRDAYFPYDDARDAGYDEHWRYGTAVNFDLDLVSFGDTGFHWRNTVRGDSTTSQFRSVLWDFRWGLALGRNVELFYDHVSQHCLECQPDKTRTYKLRNTYGLEVVFYRRQP